LKIMSKPSNSNHSTQDEINFICGDKKADWPGLSKETLAKYIKVFHTRVNWVLVKKEKVYMAAMLQYEKLKG